MKIVDLNQKEITKIDGGVAFMQYTSDSRRGIKRRVKKRKIYGGRIFNPIGALIAVGKHFYELKNRKW